MVCRLTGDFGALEGRPGAQSDRCRPRVAFEKPEPQGAGRSDGDGAQGGWELEKEWSGLVVAIQNRALDRAKGKGEL